MTTISVLGSGSRGNAIAIAAEGAVLLVDAGFSHKELHRRAEAAGVDLRLLCGIALTHEHHDHARGALRLARHFEVPVVASPGTWSALHRTARGVDGQTATKLNDPRPSSRLAVHPSSSFLPVRNGGRTECGPFTIAGCSILHDAVEPLALTVTTSRGVTIGIAFDFGRPTQALRFHFRSLHAAIVESNYDEVMLRTSGYPVSVQHRIAGSGGHLSNRATAQFLGELFQPALGMVVLTHLSQQCNAPEVARETVESVLRARGFTGRVYVADQEKPLGGIPIETGAGLQEELELG